MLLERIQPLVRSLQAGVSSLLGGASTALYAHEPGAAIGAVNVSALQTNLVDTDISYTEKAVLGDVELEFVVRRHLPLSTEERRLIRTATKVFVDFSIPFQSSAVPDEMQALFPALEAAFLEAVIARYLRSGTAGSAIDIQRVLELLQSVANKRYENNPVTTGVIVYRTLQKTLKSAVVSTGYSFLSFKQPQAFSDEFFEAPLSFCVVDGESYIYASSVKLQVSGLIQLPVDKPVDTIDKLTHYPTSRLLRKLGDNSFAAYVSRSSDIEIVTEADVTLVWRRGLWRLFDPAVFLSFLDKSLDKKNINVLAWVLFVVSKLRHGAVVLICPPNTRKLRKLRAGSTTANNALGNELVSRLKGRTLQQLKERQLLLSLFMSDGIVIVNSKGRLIDVGVIVNTSLAKNHTAAGGGRTAAAIAASYIGKVIKVSEDGPIDFYEAGKRLYRCG